MIDSSLKKFKVYLGIDWEDAKHDICLQVKDSDTRVFSILPHNVNEIDKWALSLKKKYNGPIAVAML